MAASEDAPSSRALRAYTTALFAEEPPLLAELRSETERRGFPTIQVPAETGRVLELLARAGGARRALEIGTLGGYSALWLLRGMGKDGRIVSIEKEAERAETAREFLRRAGDAERAEVLVGDAKDLLPDLGPPGSFDLVFVDADKEGYVFYLEQAGRLLRPGGVLLADNAFWKGRVLDEREQDGATEGVRAFNRALAESSEFRGTILPVGDGVAFAVREG